MKALTMELSNILQAIGADDVKVRDWSTAEPMLDIIPINFYRCRLCQNSSLKKTMMIQHLTTSHENEWKMSSSRVTELMNTNEGTPVPEELSRPDIIDLSSGTTNTPTHTQSLSSETVTEAYTPHSNRIGRLATRINHPLFLASSLPVEKKAIYAKNSHNGQLELPNTLNINGVRHDEQSRPTLPADNNLSIPEHQDSRKISTINVRGSVEQPHFSWASEWARQARLNFGRFNQTALSQPVTPPKIHMCQHCPSRFTTKKALQKHQDIHNGVLVHCDLCDFTSVWNTSVKKHKQLKHFRENLPVLSCPQCDFKTKNSDNMRRHKRKIHCRDVFSVQPFRKTPASSIAIPKFYTCEHCCKTFTTKRAMKKHQDIHNGTLVKCDLCDFTSVWSASIKKHKLLRHFREDLPVLFCPQCDFKTKNSDNLRRHRRIIHSRDHLFNHSGMSTTYRNIPTLVNEGGTNDQSGLRIHMETRENEDLERLAVLKSPKLEQKEVYITSDAPVINYFDIVNGQNDALL